MHLDAIRPVFDAPGPYLTVHAEVGRTDEHGLDQLDARWTTIRHELEHREVAAPLIEDIGERLRQNTHVTGEARRTIVATPQEVVFDQVQPGHALWPESVDLGELPDLGGWLRQADGAVSFLLVQVDRTGGDIAYYRALNGSPAEETTVQGETFQITKVPDGDWAQKQYQNRVEELWSRNAEEVAEAITSMVRHQRPDVILVAGDVRASAELVEALGKHANAVVKLESGGRAAGTSEEALWSEVQAVLAEHEAHAEQHVAERLAEGVGRGRGVAVGSADVLEALVLGQVEQLVLDLDQARGGVVHPVDFPGLELPDPARSAAEVPADRVLVAAAARSDAEIALLPGSLIPDHGVAAILRWED
ncbi:hypothetical protein ACVW00_000918 [Marmoricola sp. URHA0025 HA25]